VPPTPNECGEQHTPDNQSGSTPVPPFPVHTELHQTESGTHRSNGPSRRLGKKFEKYVRSFLRMPRRILAITVAETTRGIEAILGEPTPGSEIIDQREEELIVRDQREEDFTVRDNCIPYVVSRPIPEGKSLKKVVITVISKDQGWSNYPEDHGTYRNSLTGFELSIGSPAQGSEEKWRGLVVKNLLAHHSFKEHAIEILDGELYEKARSGDVLTVWVHAKGSGSTNIVKKVTIQCVVG